VRQLAIRTPDAGFLDRDTVSFLTVSETQQILGDVRHKFLPVMDAKIENWRLNYDSDRETPDAYFEPFKSALSEFAKALASDASAVTLIQKGMIAVDEAIEELYSDGPGEQNHGDYGYRGASMPPGGDSRSIFDDVDATVVPARWDTAAKKPNDPMG